MTVQNGYNTTPNSKYFEDIAAANDSVHSTYYVAGDAGNDSNDGKSWDNAMKTLAVAMAASHADIDADTTGGDARNRIYFKSDGSVETLTKFAQQTDIYGVGSTGLKAKSALYGNHVVPGTTSYAGCRFYNILFRGPAVTGGDIFTVTQQGMEFHECEFLATGSSTDATAAIISTAGASLLVENCVFKGEYGDAVIEIGAGVANDLVIKNNLIQGANMGIDISASATFAAGKYGVIQGNVFSTTLACVNDAESKCYVIGNRGITAAASGVALAGAVVCNIALAQDNRFTTSSDNNIEYPALGAVT